MPRSWDDAFWGLIVGLGLLIVLILSKGLFRERTRRERRWGPFLALAMCLAAGCASRPVALPGAQHEAVTPHGSGWGDEHYEPDDLIQT